MGKRWKPEEQQVCQAERMATIGMTMEQIARVLGVSYNTFLDAQKKDDSLRQRILSASEKGNSQVHDTLHSMAISGKCPSATIFWMKVRSRWKEPAAEIQALDKDGNPTDPSQVKVINQTITEEKIKSILKSIRDEV